VISAGATSYFNKPATIASFLQPLLFQKIRASVQLGPMRIENAQPILNWIVQGVITTDGSERRIPVSQTGGQFSAGLSVPKSFQGSVHTDLQGFLDGTALQADLSEEMFEIRPGGPD
jgi:hypothetical protein